MSRVADAELPALDRAVATGRPAAATARGEIPNLQVLRFLAAAMVLVSHAQHEVLSRSFLDTSGFHPFEPVWWAGGVDVFFVISGFIMCYISRRLFAAPGAPSEFLVRRLLRLVPLYWAVTTAMVAAILLVPGELAHAETSPAHVIASYLFIPWRSAYGAAFPLFIGGWTLNYEMLFYVVFALALPFRRGRALLAVTAMLVALALASRVVPRWAPLAFWCDPIVLNFLYGVGISVLYERGVRLPATAGLAVAALGVALMVGVQETGWTEQAWRLRFLWAGLPAAVLVLGTVLIRDDGAPGPFRRLLVFGGDASYSLYLTHPFFLGILAVLYRHAGLADPWGYVLGAIAICVAGSMLVYVVAERPVYRLLSARLRRRLATRRGAAAAAG